MRTPPSQPVTPPSVFAQIACLPKLPFLEIKALWRKLFGGDAPTCNRPFIERRIAYKLQEIEFRKVDPNLLERNNRKIAALVATGKLNKRDRDFRPPAGTMLTREYQGREYRVIATADGQYEFERRAYPSLSMIAREITGSRWSGPVFFGLKAYAAKAAKNTSKKRGGRS